MPTDQRKTKGGRHEFEVAYYTPEIGRPAQRKLLQRSLDALSESRAIEAAHGEEPPLPSPQPPPPPEDRAG